MLEYKGFKIPESLDEVHRTLESVPPCPVGPHLVIMNDDNTRITTMVSIESIASGAIYMDCVVEECKRIVDQWTESRGAE